MDTGPGVFAALEAFVAAHRDCGALTGGAHEATPAGYLLDIHCRCGAAFQRWVTPDAAAYDLLWSRLLTSES
jgi:hypothetical protein